MIKNFTKSITLTLFLFLLQSIHAQSVITQWNFNSVPADASTTTGSVAASTGMRILLNIGGNTATFASGSANGGSSDPATIDNYFLNNCKYPIIIDFRLTLKSLKNGYS